MNESSDADRDREDRDQRAARVQQEHEDHERDDRHLLDAACVRSVAIDAADQLGAVVGGDDLDARRAGPARSSARRAFTRVDHRAARSRRSASRRCRRPTSPSPSSSAMPRRGAGAERHRRRRRSTQTGAPLVARRAAATRARSSSVRHVAAAADHVLVAGELEHAAARLLVRRAHRARSRRASAIPYAREPVRVDLRPGTARTKPPTEATSATPGTLCERVAQVPVLEAAQLGEVERAAAVDERVLEHPADAGRVGAERGRRRPRAAAPAHAAQVLEHAAARPVEVGAVLEDRRRRTRCRRTTAPRTKRTPRRREQARRDRVGDLVLDEVRALRPATR